MTQEYQNPLGAKQTHVRNESWANITTTRVEKDGTVSQASWIIPLKRGKR